MIVLKPYIAKSLFFIVLFCCSLSGFGQNLDKEKDYQKIVDENKRDSAQVSALFELFTLQKKNDPELAKQYLDMAMTLSVEIGYVKGQAMSYRHYGSYYMMRGDYEMSEKMLNKGRSIFEDIENPLGVTSCINGLGNLEMRRGDYSASLNHFLNTAKLNEEFDNKSGLAKAYHNIGGIHYRQQRYDKASEYWQASLKIKETLGDSSGMVVTLNGLSVVHTAQENYKKALEMQYYTLSIAKSIGSLHETSSILNNIGVQHYYLGQLDSSRYYYQASLDLYKELDELDELSTQYVNLGSLDILAGNGKRAYQYFDSSYTISKKINSPWTLSVSYEGLADASKMLGDYESAFKWLKEYHALKDSLSGEKVKLQLNELQTKYETGKKDQEIIELEKKEAEAVLIADKRKAWLIMAVTSTVAVVLVLLFYIGKRKAKERQRRAELEQKALRAQMNPHFIFNSLGAIQQMYVSGEMDLANNYMGDFGILMRKILDNSGKDWINVKEEVHMLGLYLELEKGRSNELLEYSIDVDERIDQLGTNIPPLVIQPFVENAIWHGLLPKKKKGKVKVRLSMSDRGKHIVCEIEDDGVGMNERTRREGHEPKGMKLTEQRLGTKVKVKDLAPGTLVTIKIPI